MKMTYKTALCLMLALSGAAINPLNSQACIWPPATNDGGGGGGGGGYTLIPPCVRFSDGSLALQTQVFPTTDPHSCACGIGLMNPPTGLDFTTAEIGYVSLSDTSSFQSIPGFILTRNPSADSAWSLGLNNTGLDEMGSSSLPSATWFGFSNPAVPPITPPSLQPNEFFVVKFNIAGTFDPAQISGLQVLYGAGLGNVSGIPDFASSMHAARYSGQSVVPDYGYYTCPEPATHVTALISLGICSVFWAKRRVSRQ